MSTLLSIGLALLVLQTLVGIVANGFIILFVCTDWFRSRKVSSTDLILCCLGLSRFIWQVTVFLIVIMASFFKCTFVQNHVWLTFGIMWEFTNTVHLWFAAWLSVLYLVKIAIFSHPIFLQVKQRFSGLVPWLLLGSVVFSAATTIIITASTYVFYIHHPYKSLPSNSSDSECKTPHSFRDLALLTVARSFIPFLLCLSSCIFLIISLSKHLRHLRHNGMGITDLNTQVHLSAIKALASFAVLYLFSFVAATSLTVVSWIIFERHWTSMLSENVSAVYPAGHAIILILINPKMKQAWIQMLHHLRCQF